MFCRKAISPMTVGFLKPELILPQRYYSDEELNMIFKIGERIKKFIKNIVANQKEEWSIYI